MIRTVLAVVTIVAGAAVAGAQSNPLQERNELMSTIWRNGLRPIMMMARGEEPYDKAKVQASFTVLTDSVAKLPPLWPADSKPPQPPTTKFYSSSKIWDNKADFNSWIDQLKKDISDNRTRATANLEGLKIAFEAINKTCDGCHENYRLRAQ
jgi:cytochrome c556